MLYFFAAAARQKNWLFLRECTSELRMSSKQFKNSKKMADATRWDNYAEMCQMYNKKLNGKTY